MFGIRAPRIFSALCSMDSPVATELPAAALEASALEDRILFNAALPVDGSLEGQIDTADSSGAWLLEEDYSDTTANQHDPLSGTWGIVDGQYVATPGSDAVSVLQLDEPLGGNVELAVTINADDASAQYLSNAFVIFDYHAPDDFKFAGAYMGVDQWVIGHRTASDWVTDTYVHTPLHPLHDYRVGIRITGDSQITLSADGNPVLSHNYSESLTDGALGLGTKNAVACYDDLRVRSLLMDTAGSPGELPLTDDFDDSAAEHFSPEAGTWLLVDGQYEVAPSLGGDGASLLVLSETVPDDVEVGVSFEANEIIPFRFSNGVVIFDYQSATDFKYAGGFVNRDQWVIGHRTADGWIDQAVMPDVLDAFSTYDMRLVIEDGSHVTLHSGDGKLLSHTFEESVTDGALGLGSNNSVTRFDEFSVVDLTAPPPEPESNIFASFVGRDLVITGEAAGQLEIVAQKHGAFQIFDRGELRYEFSDVHGDLRIELGEADDLVTLDFDGHKFKHDVHIDLGEGANEIHILDGRIYGGLAVLGGSGQDGVFLADELSVRRDVVVDLGDGTNQFHVASAKVNGHLKFHGGSGQDDVMIAEHSTVGRDANLQLRDGDNRVAITGADVGKSLKIAGGDGHDLVAVAEHAKVHRSFLADLGNGVNTFDVSNAEIKGDLRYEGGTGADGISVARSAQIGRHAVIDLGDGENHFELADARVDGHLKIQGGVDEDVLTIHEDAFIRKNLRLATGSGGDSIQFAGTARSLFVDAGGHDDALLLSGSVWAGVHVHMGDGNDQVEVSSTSSLGKTAKIKLGDGDDTFLGPTSRRSHMVKGGQGDDTIEIDCQSRHHRHRRC